MPKMDSKAKHVSWFGNIYQKFETICNDVDNMVNQDAAKCVENQVQSMGQSMKRLYSGVVQDLAPPSVDPVPPEADSEHQPRDSDPSRDQTCHPPGDSETHVSLMEPGSTPVELCNVSADNDSAANSAEEVDMKSKSLKSELIGVSVNASANQNGIWTVEEEELYFKSSAMEVLELSTSDKIDLSEASSCSERISSGSENTSGTVSEYSAETSFEEKGKQSFQVAATIDSNHIDDSAIAAPLSEPGISVSRSNGKLEEMDSLSSRSLGFTGLHSLSKKSDNSISQNEPLAFGNSDDYLPSATFLPAVTFSLGQSVGCSCGTDNVNDSEMETIDLYDKLTLEDNGSSVDDKILHDVSRRTRKLRSFKQKIQDLFAPKKLLIKDYETLSIWYGDSDIDSSKQAQTSLSNTLGNKQAQQMHDSEWELL